MNGAVAFYILDFPVEDFYIGIVDSVIEYPSAISQYVMIREKFGSYHVVNFLVLWYQYKKTRIPLGGACPLQPEDCMLISFINHNPSHIGMQNYSIFANNQNF